MSTNQKIIVMKFGGAALGNDKNITNAALITRDFAKISQPIIIVSALKGVTNQLYILTTLCQKGDNSRALKKITSIHQYYKKTLSQLGNDFETFESQQQIQLTINLLKMFIQKNLDKKLSVAQI